MNNEIIKQIASELNILVWQVEKILQLLEEGNTIPFIARYRKEATGNLDEEVIRKISDVYVYQVNLLKRKEDVIRLIDEKGLLTNELRDEIMRADKLVLVEDLYRPFKEKKKTKATEAIKNGLEPLANKILEFSNVDVNELAKSYLNENVKTVEDAIQGAMYIIAENISDNPKFRKWIRDYTFRNGIIISKLKKNANDEKEVYKIYYDFKDNVRNIKSYRVLAINRGENENILSVKVDIDEVPIIDYLNKFMIKNNNVSSAKVVNDAIIDSYNRLISPSIEREIRSEMTDKASEVAIKNFMENLEALLLTPPMKEVNVLALDPAYRTGCKLAVLDKTGNPQAIEVIYPTPPHNQILESKKKVLELIEKYEIDVIAIGNGTASRESEQFISNVIKECNRSVKYVMVNEAGASVYSASKEGINEFPDLTVEKRSAISIGRRLQDALSELVKIDPKSIGVGLYQHDVKQKELDESLNFVVTKTVNRVGVNINTASFELLKYVAGLNKKTIDGIIAYRNTNGKFINRNELLKVKGISDKIYEQSVGFLRIIDGDNPLDKTGIHPESYEKTINLLNSLGYSINDIGKKELIECLNKLNLEEISMKNNIDIFTLEDIIKALISPNRDPRDDIPKPILKGDVLTIEDLKIGMKLQGTVRNVVDFGAFVDIGLHNDGLIHISKMSTNFVKHPSDLLKVGDIVTCYVSDIDKEKEKVNLSLIEGK